MRLPRIRFGLRTLLFIMVLVAIPSAWLGKHWMRTRVQRPIVAQILANGGTVFYDYQRSGKGHDMRSIPPGWKPIRAMLGDDFFATVTHASCGIRLPPPTSPLSIDFEQLSELEYLDLSSSYFDAQTHAKLVSLKRLKGLSLYNTNIKPELLKKLAESPALAGLLLQGNDLTLEHLRELRHFTKTTRFHFVNSPLTDDGLLAICDMSGLELLDLTWPGAAPLLSARGFQGLSKLQALKVLQLSGPADDAMAAIANLPAMESVQLLADQLTDDGLLKMATLTNLVALRTDSKQITDAGLPVLRNMPKLELLEIASPKITDAGLANLSGLARLTSLHLNTAGISDAGLPALMTLTELVELELCDATLTDNGLQQLAGLPKLKRLRITLGQNLTADGINRLRAKLPNCRFEDFQSSPGGGGSINEIP